MKRQVTVKLTLGPDLLLSANPLEGAVREVAAPTLQMSFEVERDIYLEVEDRRDGQGRRQVVRAGYHPEREIMTGVGKIPVRVPKVRSLDGGPALFRSELVPPYVRRSPTVDSAVPALYLAGVAQRDIGKALGALVGEERMRGLSASTVSRLKRRWEEEYEQWRKRQLDAEDWVYIWADGIHCQTRGPDGEPLCLLVVIGVTKEGRKEFLAIEEGPRESATAWADVLRDLRDRGMRAPRLAVADGALGFWKALGQVFPKTRGQRCWVHKVRNVLCYLPTKIHDRATGELREIWLSETEADARAAAHAFIRKYRDKYPKAAQCLERDLDALLAYYHYPAAHWQSLRTTNPIESAFATIRHRTRQTRNCVSSKTVTALVYKLARAAESQWKLMTGHEKLAPVFRFVPYKDGEAQGHEDEACAAAA